MRNTLAKSVNFVQRVNNIDAHHRLYIALGIALSCFLALYGKMSSPIHLMITWLVYSLVNLAFSWFTILASHPSEVRKHAHDQDSSRTFVFIFVISAAFASLLAVVILLQTKGDLTRQEMLLHVIISTATVISSWWLVHTVFTLRYAHFYYCNMDKDKRGKHEEPGGLDFPEEPKPDYLDFTYFSFIIGTTFQVSDVRITSRRIRRLVWMHGVMSFAFNTIIVALAINIISGLVQRS